MKLTDAVAKALKLPDGKTELLVFDDAVKGFGLRLRAGGKRVWVCQFRIGVRQRRVTLGNIEALNAAEARKRAREMISKAALGQDAQTEIKIAKAAASETLQSIFSAYLISSAFSDLKERTRAEVKRALVVHWKSIAELPIMSVSRGVVASRLDEIASQSGPFAANRARAYLSAVFNWAVQRGRADRNPVSETARATNETRRDRVLSDDELALIWEHAGNGDYGNIVRLLALTGQRREEVSGMDWSEIDQPKALWSIPARRTKNGLSHEVPLSDLSLKIISNIPRKSSRSLVFGSGKGGFSGWSRSKISLDERIKAATGVALTPWRLHDLRRTFATRLSDLGVLPHVVEALLNHISGHKAGVAGIYNKATYRAEKTAALKLWDAHIQRLNKGVPNA